MAIVMNPAMSMDASGNMGAICYSRWRGRKVARAASTLVVTPSAAQLVINGRVGYLAAYWGMSLTGAQRQLWEDSARQVRRLDRLKQEYSPSGYNWFLACNLLRNTIGLGTTSTPIIGPKAVLITTLSLVWSLSHLWVAVSMSGWGGGTPPDSIQIWRAGPFISPARNATRNEFRLVNYKRPAGTLNDTGVLAGFYYIYRVRGVDVCGKAYNWFEGRVHT